MQFFLKWNEIRYKVNINNKRYWSLVKWFWTQINLIVHLNAVLIS